MRAVYFPGDGLGTGTVNDYFEGSANVVKATSAAHRTPVHDADRWFCELDSMGDSIREWCYHGSRRRW